MRIALSSLLLLSICACNTMEGLGKDVQSMGSSLEHTADKHNPANQQKKEEPPRTYPREHYHSAPITNY